MSIPASISVLDCTRLIGSEMFGGGGGVGVWVGWGGVGAATSGV